MHDKIQCRMNFAKLNDCVVPEEEVRKCTSRLNPDKHDGKTFYSNHLIHGGNALAERLSQLYTAMLVHGYTPVSLLDAKLVSIPKDKRANLCCSDNYRGIALIIAIAKLFDLIILDRCGNTSLVTKPLQFAYKVNHSTSMCTTMLKETIHYFWSKNSVVFAAFVDATKAFDLVDFEKLFELLLLRGVPGPIIRLLFDGYRRQRVTAIWNGCESKPFPVTNGVRQGAIASAVLFSVYLDELLSRLERAGIGCHINDNFYGAFAYADDLTLLAPTIGGLSQMINVMEAYGTEYMVKFNPNKTKCMAFPPRKNITAELPVITVAGRDVEWVEKFKYLGTLITPNLTDRIDIENKRAHFIRSANYVLSTFSVAPANVKSRLVQTYCTSLHGCQSWKLADRTTDKLRTAWNVVQRKVWRLPNMAHSKYLPHLAGNDDLKRQMVNRFRKFNMQLERSNNPVVKSLYELSRENTLSVFHMNMAFLDQMEDVQLPDDNTLRIVSQIRELNECMDNQSDCGLTTSQIKDILYYISTM